MHVSLSSKTIQSNTQNLCLSPLVLENSLPLSVQMCCFRGYTQVFSVLLHHINLKSDFVSEEVVVENVSLLFGIDLTGDKVIMDQIISEEPSYEEKELKKYRNFSFMCYNCSRKETSGRRWDFIAGWYHTNKWCWNKRHIVFGWCQGSLVAYRWRYVSLSHRQGTQILSEN